jgi:putative tricarboxylic transport membrane protein
MSSDRVFGLILFALALGMAGLATQFQAQISYEPIGPRAFPMLVAGLLALGSLWFMVRPGPSARWPRDALARKVALLIALLLAYAFLFQPLGFIVATALMTVGVGRLFGGGWKQSAIGGALLGLGLYVLFDVVLDVTLPLGDLWRSGTGS